MHGPICILYTFVFYVLLGDLWGLPAALDSTNFRRPHINSKYQIESEFGTPRVRGMTQILALPGPEDICFQHVMYTRHQQMLVWCIAPPSNYACLTFFF